MSRVMVRCHFTRKELLFLLALITRRSREVDELRGDATLLGLEVTDVHPGADLTGRIASYVRKAERAEVAPIR